MPLAQILLSLPRASSIPNAASNQYPVIGLFITRLIGAGNFLLQTIAESLAEHGGRSQEPDVPPASVRVAQSSLIALQINEMASKFPVNRLQLVLEQLLHYTLQASERMQCRMGNK